MHFDYLVRREVIVNTKTGIAFRGVAWARKGRYLVLRNVTIHDGEREPAVVDGEVVLARDNIDWVQIVGASA